MIHHIQNLSKIISGDIENSPEILSSHARDASIFRVMPELVIFPKNPDDIKQVVRYVADQKNTGHDVHLTMRAAGTCMSGGSLNTSIIIDTTRYMNSLLEITDDYVRMQPGLYYRDLETETLKCNRIMPAFTASKHLCAVGGMFGNNCAGEKTLKYGKMEDYVLETKVVLTDGNEYVVKPLTKTQFDEKISQTDFEGRIYKQVWELIQKNSDIISAEKPIVSKNSAGYYLWNVWDQERQIFDLNKLLVGSQGTLGIVTEMTWRIIPVEHQSAMLVTFLPNIKNLGELVNICKSVSPSSIESFDDYSLKFAFKFATDFIGQLGLWGAIRLGLRFIPETLLMLRTGIPKLILMTEVTGNSEAELLENLSILKKQVTEKFGYVSRISRAADAEKYWRIRRESFNLLRKHVQGLHTAPFIDDVVVPVEVLAEFLPKITAILDREGFIYTVAGHAGNGNFHIIPLMDFKDPVTIETIKRISHEVYTLVTGLHGSITAEHNDGLIRTMFLPMQFSSNMIGLFKQTKEIFDPQYMLNPDKKVPQKQAGDVYKYIIND
jgi:FAD/FMN-containing dehydrogenase